MFRLAWRKITCAAIKESLVVSILVEILRSLSEVTVSKIEHPNNKTQNNVDGEYFISVCQKIK